MPIDQRVLERLVKQEAQYIRVLGDPEQHKARAAHRRQALGALRERDPVTAAELEQLRALVDSDIVGIFDAEVLEVDGWVQEPDGTWRLGADEAGPSDQCAGL